MISMITNGYDPLFYKETAAVEKRHFWFRHRVAVIKHVLNKFLPFPYSFKMLEVGAGACFISANLQREHPSSFILSSDLNSAGLKIGREKYGAKAVVANLLTNPFKTKFDVIGMFDVLEHIEDDNEFLLAVNDGLGDNGLFILTVPSYPILWSYHDIVSGHKRRYLKDELKRKLQRAGFKPIYFSHFFSFLLPLMWLSRRTSVMSRDKMIDSVKKQLRPPFAVNFLLFQASLLERLIIRSNIKLPFGTSLIAVAKRG